MRRPAAPAAATAWPASSPSTASPDPPQGTVSVELAPNDRLVVTGEQVFDIRDFDVPSPTVLMLRIYPDVRVHLHVEANLEEEYGMIAFIALVVGYVMGAKAGSRDLDQVTSSLKRLGESEEFADVVSAVRSHLGHTLRELGDDGRRHRRADRGDRRPRRSGAPPLRPRGLGATAGPGR